MDLRDLAYFEKIVETGHLGRAAEHVGRTKPALTKCIRRLEDSVGSALFERKGRRLELTAVGRLLFERSRYMRVAMEELNAEIRDLVQGQIGHLRIGAGPTVGVEWLPDILLKLLGSHSGVTCEIAIGMGRDNRSMLVENRLDLIISAVSPEDYEAFQVFPIGRDDVVVVARQGHRLAGRTLRLQDFVGSRWILPDKSAGTRQWLEGAFGMRGLPRPDVQIVANSLHVVPKLVERSELLSFVARSNLKPGRVAQNLVEVRAQETTMPRLLGVLCRKSSNQPPVLKQLLRLLRETFADELPVSRSSGSQRSAP